MATPISNDKIMPSDSNRASVSEKNAAEKGGAGKTNTSGTTITDQDTSAVEASSVDVERANQVYSRTQAQVSPKEDAIHTHEQASALVAKISEQIEQDGLQALQAQAGSASASLSALLEAAPV